MVTVLRDSGFRIVIYSNDHDPAHVHVVKGKSKGSGHAKFNIASGVELVEAVNLNASEIRKAGRIVRDNQQLLLEKWNEIHG